LKIQYNRNRYYDYYTGRWLTQDPVEYMDSMNLYEYAFSNPIANADPDGLLSIRGIGGGIRRIGRRIQCGVFRRLYNSVNAPGISETERIRRIRRLYEAMANYGWIGGYPQAAGVMRYWLSGGKSNYKISRNFTLSTTESREAYKKLKDKVKDNVWCSEEGITPTFSEFVRTPPGTDLYYTTGYFNLKAYGMYWKSWLCKSCYRKLKIYFSMRDPYDWHTGLGVMICGLRIPDEWARDLGVADRLHTFDVYAEWTDKEGCVKCKCH